MSAQTGLLVVSNPKHISKILSSVHKQVKNTLYIQLLSALGDPLGAFQPKVFNNWPKFSKTLFNIYSQVAVHCNHLDVKVLISGLKYNIPKIHTKHPIDIVIFDKTYSQSDIEHFIKAKINNITERYETFTLDTGKAEFEEDSTDETVCDHVVLGGTFDRIHVAHKFLLSEVALRARKVATIGITDENMIKSKLLWEFIEDVDVRMKNVKEFLSDICPELEYRLVPISDPFGPTVIDPTMELLVLSQETISGGLKINEVRKGKDLPELHLLPIDLIDEPNPGPNEEKKISSSNTRIRLLGTVIHPVKPNPQIPKSPYIIGLTGGIATGKSGVAKHLTDLGAHVIYCDNIGHDVYRAGKPCFDALVGYFGKRIVGGNGEVDRKILGEIVFSDKKELDKLNSIVWPHILEEVENIIKGSDKKIIVIEAAVLLKAGWEKKCHEVWTTIVPRKEVISRLVNRNGLTEQQAVARVEAQPPSTFFVEHSNVVFCPYWEVEYTRQQVVKAWELLQERIAQSNESKLQL